MKANSLDSRQDHGFRFHAQLLGYLGVFPLLVAGGLVMAQIQSAPALDFIKNYAAIILTFIGAIHWGRAMSSGKAGLLSLSIIPSIVASACLMLPLAIALPALAISFILLLLLDYGLYTELSWFRRLRLRLTSLVALILAITWLAPLHAVTP